MQITVEKILSITKGLLLKGDTKENVNNIFYDVIKEDSPKSDFLYIPYINSYRKIDTSAHIESMPNLGATGVIIDKKLHGDCNIDNYSFAISVDDLEIAVLNIAKYLRYDNKLNIVAVTGSSGKTTSKELISAILYEHNVKHKKTLRNINGYGGAAHTIFSLDKNGTGVLEVGVNGLKRLPMLADTISPDFLLVTNIYPTHFDKLPNLHEVAKYKMSLANAMEKGGKKVIYGQCEILRTYGDSNTLTFGWSKDNDYYVWDIKICDENGSVFEIATPNGRYSITTPLLGKHNIINCVGVFALCAEMGIPTERIITGIGGFRGIKDEFYSSITLEDVEGWKFLDDSQHFNLPALNVGLEIFTQIVGEKGGTVILSFDYKFLSPNFNFSDLLDILGKYKSSINKLVLIDGQWKNWSHKLEMDFRNIGYVEDKNQCVKYIKDHIKKGEYIYLKGDFHHHLRGIINILKGEDYEVK